MKEKNSVSGLHKRNSDGIVPSKAELRRLCWHLEKLKSARLRVFHDNMDELVEAGERTTEHYFS